MCTGNAICMLAGTPTLAGAAIAMIVAKPIVAADISGRLRERRAHASEHAVADREGVMKL